MDLLNGWDLSIVHFLQALGAWLTRPMMFFTLLGKVEFYLAVMPLVFWCISKPLGSNLNVLLISSFFLNTWAKSLLQQPRPFWLSPGLNLDNELSFGAPSGHAMNAVCLWGYLALTSRSAWRWLCLLIIVLISISRVYLAVHFVRDILLGWLLGILLLWAYLRLKPRLLPRLRQMTAGQHALAALLAALSVMALCLLAEAIPAGPYSGRNAELFSAAVASGVETAATVSGMVFGLWLGLAVEARYVRFNTDGTLGQRALRYVIGGLGVLVFWLGLKLVVPGDLDPAGLFLRAARYALVLLWVTVAWPWLFVRLGLARRTEAAAEFVPTTRLPA